jgi:hypothetical protein
MFAGGYTWRTEARTRQSILSLDGSSKISSRTRVADDVWFATKLELICLFILSYDLFYTFSGSFFHV